MWIKELRVKSFGCLKNVVKAFNSGFNLISNKNESGKSTSVELIKAGLSGFDKIKGYEYLPCDGDRIEFEVLLSFFDKDIRVERKHSGDRTSAGFFMNEKKHKLSNKALIPAVSEVSGIEYEYLSPDLYFIDSDSLAEHQRFLNSKDDEEISYLDIINYKGKDLSIIREDINNEMKSLYTNNKNSNSEFNRNNTEIEKLTEIIKEIDFAEKENSDIFKEYQNFRVDYDKIDKEIDNIKKELELAKTISEENEIKIEYLKLAEEEKNNSYDKALNLPSLEEYLKLQGENESLNKEIQKLEHEKDELSKIKIDEELKKIVIYSMDKSLPLSRIFKGILENEEKRNKLQKIKAQISPILNSEAGEINTEKALNELDFYQNAVSELDFKEAKVSVFPLLIFTLAGFIFIMISLFDNFQKNLSVPLFILGAASLIFSAFNYLRDKKKIENKYVKRQEKINNIKENKTVELRKLKRASEMLNSFEIPNKDTFSLIRKDIDEVSGFQEILFDYQLQKKEIYNFFISHKEINYLMKVFDNRQISIFVDYLEKESDIKFYINTLNHLNEKADVLLKKINKTKEDLSGLRAVYINQIGSSEAEDIRKFKNKAEITKENQKKLRDYAIERGININEPIKKQDDIFSLKEKIEIKEKQKSVLKEKIIRFEDRLSRPALMIPGKYSHLNKDELIDIRNALKERNNIIREEYNVLYMEDKILKNMLEILRSKSRPMYIDRAEEFFKKIAPDSGIKISYDDASSIVFIDTKTETKQSFSSLSTGTQAQVVLCLKLAYLCEKDPENLYPLIIDDALMAYDKNREDKTVDLLKFIAEKRQVIYFTAR